MPNDSWPYTDTIASLTRDRSVSPYPSTTAEWRDRYDALLRAYEQGNYSDAEVKADKLFQANDDSGKLIDMARRLFGFFRFITDVDAWAIVGPKGLTLETDDVAPVGALLAGELVWRRTRIAQVVGHWARMTACQGDYYVEAVRQSSTPPYRVKLVGYLASDVVPVYDVTGTELVSVTIETVYTDGGDYDDAVKHTYKREVDAVEVVEYVDGKETSRAPHRAGRVPVVHLSWTPWIAPDHGLPAAHGLDAAIARLNSFAGQVGAIGNRYADPKTVIRGATVGSSSDLGLFGRVISGLPADGGVEYLEPRLSAIPPLLDALREVIQHIRETAPEFIFAESSAAESGTARSYRAAALEMKIGEVRNRWLPAIAEITGVAVAMDQGRAYDEAVDAFEVQAAPFIAPNVMQEVDVLMAAQSYLRRADIVERLQSLGIASDALTVEQYLAALDDERMASGGPVIDGTGIAGGAGDGMA